MCQTKGNSMVFTLYAIELPSMNHQGDIHDVHQKKKESNIQNEKDMHFEY